MNTNNKSGEPLIKNTNRIDKNHSDDESDEYIFLSESDDVDETSPQSNGNDIQFYSDYGDELLDYDDGSDVVDPLKICHYIYSKNSDDDKNSKKKETINKTDNDKKNKIKLTDTSLILKPQYKMV